MAGTYGCFLKKWTAQSSGALVVRPRELFPLAVDSIFRVGDVFTLETSPSDIVYLDPPYTKRQYASYYHIPETIAYHDEPAVEGVAGLRPWKKMASPFCYKTKALNAILECIAGLDAKRVFLSMAQGMSLDDLLGGWRSAEMLRCTSSGKLAGIGRTGLRPRVAIASRNT
ncbi:MAG: DNA adenine methylase [Collinsella sp.]